jgi:protein involved in polysaccharide export with SLBB domain
MKRPPLSKAGLLAVLILARPLLAQPALQIADLFNAKSPGVSTLSALQTPTAQDLASHTTDQAGMFEPVADSLYVLGPGDNLGVGLGGRIVFTTVNPEGMVIFENIGTVPVGDITLREARKLIIAKASKAFKEERIFVTLSRAKKIKASVVGEVQSPGLYEMEATGRLTDILQKAGGFGPNANRKVTISKRNGSILSFDLNGYFRGNDLGQNPYLNAGDQVRFEEVDLDLPTVRISENDQIITVQLRDGQSAYELVSEYFSVRKPRHWDYIKVYRDGSSAAVIDKKSSRTYVPEAGSYLELQSYKPLVFVSGAVSRPAAFEFNASFNALDYIANSGITTFTGDYRKVRVIDAGGEERVIDSSRDRINAGDHILIPQSKESRMRDWLSVLASIAGIASSIALTVVTINSINSN